MSDPFRRTGRTSRTLAAAAARKAEGHRVLVIVNEHSEVDVYRRYPEAEGLISADFTTVTAASRFPVLRGRRRDDVFLDHFAYEHPRVSDVLHDVDLFPRCPPAP